MFNWNKWLEGLLVSGSLAVVAAIGPFLENGLDKGDLYSLLVVFVGGIALYCKVHPPDPWDGEDRRDK